jgi:flagellar M-ring protein FliF
VLDLDQNRVTTEEVLPAKTGSPEGSPTGIVVHERQTMHDGGAITSGVALAAVGHEAQAGNVTSFDNEYQVGRRVEQTVVAPGGTRRLTVAVVVKHALDDAQVEKIKEVVSLAIGLNVQRGDAVVVSTMDRLLTSTNVPGNPIAINMENDPSAGKLLLDQSLSQKPEKPRSAFFDQMSSNPLVWIISILVVGFMLLILTLLLRSSEKPSAKKRLSDTDREKLLHEVRQWIAGQNVVSVGAGDGK